jgi:aryl-alcohol dehydrogenase-like predicted oxidoreductase
VACRGSAATTSSATSSSSRQLRGVAEAKGVTVAQLAIAWVLARGADIVPIVGARTRNRLAEALGALDVEVSSDDLAAIERAIPPDRVAGERYDARQMATLDSEHVPG